MQKAHKMHHDNRDTIVRRLLKRYSKAFHKIALRSPFIWTPQEYIYKDSDHEERNSKAELDKYNAVARRLLRGTNVIFWESYAQSANALDDSLDQVHLGPQSRAFFVDAIVNFLCNARANHSEQDLCCVKRKRLINLSPPLSSSVITILSLLYFATCLACLGWLVLSAFLFYSRPDRS